MGIPAHPEADVVVPEVETVRRGARQCFGAGSMVALLLVLSVMPGAAALAAPEAMSHINFVLHEVVRPKPDRDPREPGVSIREVAVATKSSSACAICVIQPTVDRSIGQSGRSERTHAERCEMFASRPWCMSTPPPAGC